MMSNSPELSRSPCLRGGSGGRTRGYCTVLSPPRTFWYLFSDGASALAWEAVALEAIVSEGGDPSSGVWWKWRLSACASGWANVEFSDAKRG